MRTLKQVYNYNILFNYMSDNKKPSTFKSLLPNVLTPDSIKDYHSNKESCAMHDYPGHFSSVIEYPYPVQSKEKQRDTMTNIHKSPIKNDCGCGK